MTLTSFRDTVGDVAQGSQRAAPTAQKSFFVSKIKSLVLKVPDPLVAVLRIGTFIGAINGVLSTLGMLQLFIATLATNSMAAGLAVFVTGGNAVNGFPRRFLSLTQMSVFGVPISKAHPHCDLLIAGFFLRFRSYGRANFAIGGNEEVARLSGVPICRIKIIDYIVDGWWFRLCLMCRLLLSSAVRVSRVVLEIFLAPRLVY